MAPICKFWQQGYCKNGGTRHQNNTNIRSSLELEKKKRKEKVKDEKKQRQQLTMSINLASCRFEHTNANANPFASNSNRFSALNAGGSSNSNSNSNSYKPQENPYKITKDSIKTDLTDERPRWILSCYGPGRDAPEQLFGGHSREQSLEEVMLHIRSSGNEQQAVRNFMVSFLSATSVD